MEARPVVTNLTEKKKMFTSAAQYPNASSPRFFKQYYFGFYNIY